MGFNGIFQDRRGPESRLFGPAAEFCRQGCLPGRIVVLYLRSTWENLDAMAGSKIVKRWRNCDQPVTKAQLQAQGIN